MRTGRRATDDGAPRPAWPRSVAAIVKTMDQLHLHAGVLRGEAFDPEPTLDLGAADNLPRDQALSTSRTPLIILEEGPTEAINGTEQPGGAGSLHPWQKAGDVTRRPERLGDDGAADLGIVGDKC